MSPFSYIQRRFLALYSRIHIAIRNFSPTHLV